MDSATKNKIKPNFKLTTTTLLWDPKVFSLQISLNQHTKIHITHLIEQKENIEKISTLAKSHSIKTKNQGSNKSGIVCSNLPLKSSKLNPIGHHLNSIHIFGISKYINIV
jgi:hypothetical protein